MLQAPGYESALPAIATDDLQRVWNTYPTTEQLQHPYNEVVHAADVIATQFKSREIHPDTSARNIKYGLYPNSEDPDFASRLYMKKEYAMLQSGPTSEDTCKTSGDVFETTAIQQLVARFLSPMTPYRSLLLNHGVGVGKTCTAITVSEAFLEVMPYKKVYIIAPSAIADGFRRTIFNPKLLKRTTPAERAATGHAWTSPQCTGMTYLELTGNTANTNLDEIGTQTSRIISKRYVVKGYIAFANMIEAEYKRVGQIQGHMTDDDKTEVLMRMFSDSLMIVDEAHNLRDADAQSKSDEPDITAVTAANEGKAITPILKRIAEVAEGMRLMLMTATPMYDTAPEIIHLLNLLILNDTKDSERQLQLNTVFGSDKKLLESGEILLANEIKKYVSYMRGENPNTFPLRLNPPETTSRKFYDGEYVRKLATTRAEGEERAIVLSETHKNILAALPIVITGVLSDSLVGGNLTRALSGDSGSMLDQIMQMGNISYTDELYGSRGWEACMKEDIITVKSTRIKQYDISDKFKKTADGTGFTLDELFGASLHIHAPKIANIVKSITSAEGMSFVYSRYVKAGALVIAAALELVGWCRVLPDGTPAPLLKQQKPRGGYTHYYVLLTGDPEISAPNISSLIEYATTFETSEQAEKGTRVKAIIGSQIASEGLDLKCIRELHILDGWYHLNRIEQIEGRGVRFCSHVALEMAKRNCLIYLHAIDIPDYESADLYAYRIAVKKAQPIGRVTSLIKRYAWDCMMNINAILLSGVGSRTIIDAHGRKLTEYELRDKPYSALCDFSQRCEYVCAAQQVPSGTNLSTYKDTDFRRQVAEIQQMIVTLFANLSDPFLSIESIYTIIDKKDKARAVNTTKGNPLNVPSSVISYAIRNMIGTTRIKRPNNATGTLVASNGYLMFHPYAVTETQIPLSMRYEKSYGRLHQHMSIVKPILDITAPQVQLMEDAPVITTDIETLLTELTTWSRVINQIIATPYGPIEMPPKMLDTGGKKDALTEFDGIRWVIYHFKSLPEIHQVAYSWWMDHKWTSAERASVVKHWVVNGVSDTHVAFADCLRPNELFNGSARGEAVNGYMESTIDGNTSKLTVYRYMGDGEPTKAIEMDLEYIATVTEPPIDRKNATGPVFGIISPRNGGVVFKCVDKSESYKGAECATSSNLEPHRARIRKIQDIVRSHLPVESDFRGLLMVDTDNADAKKAKEPQINLTKMYKGTIRDGTDPMTHMYHLTLKQVCPYMEFILRIMNIKKLDNKHWFMSLTDLTRSPGIKEPRPKK